MIHPMNLAEACAILRANSHNSRIDWEPDSDGLGTDLALSRQWSSRVELTEFEAIAIAERYLKLSQTEGTP